MHEGAYRFVQDTVRRLEPRRSVIELGSCTVAGNWEYSGPIRPLFTDAEFYVGVDIVAGPNVDEVGNAATWQPKRKRLVDTVVCCETLEHTPEGADICANAHSLLEPGGVLILTAAGEGRARHSAVDGGPNLQEWEHYANVTRDDLRLWLKPFEFTLIDTFSWPTDIQALAVKAR
jgi:hypothetical protein